MRAGCQYGCGRPASCAARTASACQAAVGGFAWDAPKRALSARAVASGAPDRMRPRCVYPEVCQLTLVATRAMRRRRGVCARARRLHNVFAHHFATLAQAQRAQGSTPVRAAWRARVFLGFLRAATSGASRSARCCSLRKLCRPFPAGKDVAVSAVRFCHVRATVVITAGVRRRRPGAPPARAVSVRRRVSREQHAMATVCARAPVICAVRAPAPAKGALPLR